MAISMAWSGWVHQGGDLLNVYTMGALTSNVEPPPVEDVNLLLNVPDKIPTDLYLPGNVIVHDGRGNPIMGADVTLSGGGLRYANASGETRADGVFWFNQTRNVASDIRDRIKPELGVTLVE